jgi:hypothetical protein
MVKDARNCVVLYTAAPGITHALDAAAPVGLPARSEAGPANVKIDVTWNMA